MSKHKGSSFDSFLDERGIKEEVHLRAKKSVLVDELLDAMKAAKLTRAGLAKRMATSRTEVYRLLDPENTGVTLATIARATTALGMDFEVSLTAPRRQVAARGRNSGGQVAITTACPSRRASVR